MTLSTEFVIVVYGSWLLFLEMCLGSLGSGFVILIVNRFFFMLGLCC